MSIAEKLTTIASNQQRVYDAGYSAGQQAGGGGDWFAKYTNALDGNYKGAFASVGWTDETYTPTETIVCTKGASTGFTSARITDTKVPIELRCADITTMFAGCDKLKTIPLLGFYGVTTSSSVFAGCSALENITTDGVIQSGLGFSGSPKLTNASVQSVIDHLADLNGQESKRLTFHANTKAEMTDEQTEAIWLKNWTIG